jgi:hypothetical protein
MNPKRWLYLSNLIEVLQDEVTGGRGEDVVVTAQYVHDLMNDPENPEESVPDGEFVLGEFNISTKLD